MRTIIFILAVHLAVSAFSQEVTINEFMSLNETTIVDEDGDFSDWIELYNESESPVNLSGWYLSDDEDEPYKWQIEAAVIPAESHLLVFASSKDRRGPGQLHADFKLSSQGEPLLLSDQDGLIMDFISPRVLSADVSFGSLEDGLREERVYFESSSPGEPNSEGTPSSFETDILSFSRPSGFYDSEFVLEISSEQAAEVRYTLDGSDPTSSSILYIDGIQIKDLFGKEDELSLIRTGLNWEPPNALGEKASVVKAASFLEGLRRSPVHTASYFISERLHQRYENLPVISLSVDADSLFSSDRGIYVPGDSFEESNSRTTGNYYLKGRDWEREVHMEFFDEDHDRQFELNAGARIHGKSSRNHPQKTIRLYARSEYGQSKFEYQFFEEKEIDEFKRILLRSPSTDYGRTMFRDVLSTSLVKELNLDYMAFQTCIVFINGEYWGVHTMRERIDEHYLAQNHQVDPDNVDLIALSGEVEEGSVEDFESLLTYVQNNDLSRDDVYRQVMEDMDVDNFMDYYIAQLYFANSDWPFVNTRYWKSRTEDSKWRWIFYDCDRCMLNHELDQLDEFIQLSGLTQTDPEWSTIIFNSLLNNDDFRSEFVQRFIHHLSTTFQADRVLAEINELEDLYEPLMAEHNNRWNYPGSVNFWKESIEEMRAFVIRRPALMTQQLLNYFGEQYTIYPNPASRLRGYVNLDMEYVQDVAASVRIYTTQGEEIFELDLSGQRSEEHPRIPIHDLRSGLYIVQIQYGVLVFYDKMMID